MATAKKEEVKAEGIYGKLLEARKSVGYIQKDATNTFQKYKYASALAVIAKVLDVFNGLGLVTIAKPNLVSLDKKVNKNGAEEISVVVALDLRIRDVDSGEEEVFVGLGGGQDSGDKAVMKAETAALKYALMMSLLIPTGDDPEGDENTDKGSVVSEAAPLITAEQISKVFEVAGGDADICRGALKKLGYKKSADVKVSDYEELLKIVKDAANEAKD